MRIGVFFNARHPLASDSESTRRTNTQPVIIQDTKATDLTGHSVDLEPNASTVKRSLACCTAGNRDLQARGFCHGHAQEVIIVLTTNTVLSLAE